MWQAVGEPSAGLAVLLEGELRAQHFWHTLDEGKLLALEEFLGAILAIEFGQIRLVVEQLVLRWRTGHVQVDHALGRGWKLRQHRGQRLGRIPRQPAPSAASGGGQPQRTEPAGAG